MALPKVGYPTYELELPSTGKTVKYRPFLVKEEKVLLLALESEDEKQITTAVKDLIKNCVVSRIKVDQLPIFDLEYLFLNIRGASIGESINLTVTCQDDNETKVDVRIPIGDIKVFKPEGHSAKIEFDDTFGVVMKYPSMQRFIELDFLQKNLNTDEVFSLIGESIDEIFHLNYHFEKCAEVQLLLGNKVLNHFFTISFLAINIMCGLYFVLFST